MKKTISILMPIFFILSQYHIIRGISYFDVFLILTFVLIVSSKGKVVYKKEDFLLLIFIFWLLITTILSLLFQYDYYIFDIITRSVRLIFYLFIGITMLPKYLDMRYFIKTYGLMVIISTLFLFLQLMIFQLTNIYISGILPFLRLSNEFYTFNPVLIGGTFLRASSLFLEPGYYAQYIIPYLIFILFASKNHLSLYNVKNRFRSTSLIVLGIILSTSGQGISLLLIIFIIWFGKEIYYKNLKFIHMIAIMMLVGISTVILFESEFMRSIFERLVISPNSTTGIRIVRGFEIYSQIDTVSKFIGIGYGNIGGYLLKYNITTKFDAFAELEYLSSFSNILITTGVLGSILLVNIFINKIILKNNLVSIVSALIFLILLFTSSILISTTAILYYLFIFGLSKSTLKFTKNY